MRNLNLSTIEFKTLTSACICTKNSSQLSSRWLAICRSSVFRGDHACDAKAVNCLVSATNKFRRVLNYFEFRNAWILHYYLESTAEQKHYIQDAWCQQKKKALNKSRLKLTESGYCGFRSRWD